MKRRKKWGLLLLLVVLVVADLEEELQNLLPPKRNPQVPLPNHHQNPHPIPQLHLQNLTLHPILQTTRRKQKKPLIGLKQS